MVLFVRFVAVLDGKGEEVMGLTQEDLAHIAEWLKSERVGNAFLAKRGQLSGSELATEHVATLLAEVRRLRAALCELYRIADDPDEGRELYQSLFALVERVLGIPEGCRAPGRQTGGGA